MTKEKQERKMISLVAVLWEMAHEAAESGETDFVSVSIYSDALSLRVKNGEETIIDTFVGDFEKYLEAPVEFERRQFDGVYSYYWEKEK